MSTVCSLPVAAKLPLDMLLLDQLLLEQQSLSAVEAFSNWHTENDYAPSTYRSLMPVAAPSPGQQYAFEVDLDACSGCKACVVACHNRNGLEANETWRKVGTLHSTITELPVVQHVTTACHHCAEPGCLKGCPVQAYAKDPATGIVKHLDDQCFGCQYCTMMCPYEVPQYSEDLGIVRKCDMCSQRLAADQMPACVEGCPNRAIRITVVDTHADLESTAAASSHSFSASRADSGLVPTAPPNSWTKPTTRYLSKRSLDSSLRSRESTQDELHHAHWPLVVMLVLTQTSVGAWLFITARSITGGLYENVDLVSAIVASAVGIVGVHAALLHLGRPMLAYRAILGWRTSWLSREAILFGFFMALCGATIGSAWLRMDVQIVRTLTVLTLLCGLAATASSAMIYVATKRLLWNGWRTCVDFAGTGIALGLALDTLSRALLGTESQVWSLVACVVSAISFGPKVQDWLRASDRSNRKMTVDGRLAELSFAQRSGELMRRDRALVCLAIVVLWSVATIALVACCFGLNWLSALVAFACLLVSHLLSRSLYFSTVITHRMPGANS